MHMNQKGFALAVPIIIIVLLASAGGYFALAKRSKSISRQQVATTKPVDETGAWKSYKIKGYSFKYPASWVASVPSNTQKLPVYFVNSTGDDVARLVCPIGQLLSMNPKVHRIENRQINAGATMHTATLWTEILKPGSALHPFNSLFMYRGSPKKWGAFNNKDDSSCELTNDANGLDLGENTFRAMYESVRYGEETPPVTSESTALKTYTNTQYGFYLQYPDINDRLKTFGVWTDKNEPKITYRAPFDYNLCNREGPGFNALTMTIAGRKYCLETFYGVEVGTLGYDLEYISRVGNEDFGIQFSFKGNRDVVNSHIIEKVQPFFDQIISTFQLITKEQKMANDRCLQLYGSPRLEDSMLHGEKQIFCSFGLIGNAVGECTQGELNDGTCFKEKE